MIRAKTIGVLASCIGAAVIAITTVIGVVLINVNAASGSYFAFYSGANVTRLELKIYAPQGFTEFENIDSDGLPARTGSGFEDYFSGGVMVKYTHKESYGYNSPAEFTVTINLSSGYVIDRITTPTQDFNWPRADYDVNIDFHGMRSITFDVESYYWNYEDIGSYGNIGYFVHTACVLNGEEFVDIELNQISLSIYVVEDESSGSICNCPCIGCT